MGAFVTDDDVDGTDIFPDGDKVAAPNLSRPATWTTDNVTRASEMNAIRDALLDLRTVVRAFEQPRPTIERHYPIALQVVDANTVRVFVKKDRAYLLLTMSKGAGTSTDSEAGNTEFWRQTTVVDVSGGAYVLDTTAPTEGTTHASAVDAWASSTFSLGTNGANRLLPYRETQQQGDYLEWTVTGPTVSVGFVASVAGGADMDVSIDGAVIDTVNNNSTAEGIFRREYSVSPGTHTLRIAHNDATPSARAYVIGPNFFPLDEALPGLTYGTAVYYGRDDTAYPGYITNAGAHEYAIRNDATGKWAGSYHGGETAEDAAIWRLDGVATTLSVGDVRVCKRLKVEQHTSIAWANSSETLETRSTWDFHDKGCSLECAMYGSVTARSFFTHMTPTSTTFARVLFPADVDTSGAHALISGGRVLLGRSNKVVQQHPSTGRTITSWFTLQPGEQSSYGGAYVLIDATYLKVYYGLCDASARDVTSAAWVSTWLFN